MSAADKPKPDTDGRGERGRIRTEKESGERGPHTRVRGGRRNSVNDDEGMNQWLRRV